MPGSTIEHADPPKFIGLRGAGFSLTRGCGHVFRAIPIILCYRCYWMIYLQLEYTHNDRHVAEDVINTKGPAICTENALATVRYKWPTKNADRVHTSPFILWIITWISSTSWRPFWSDVFFLRQLGDDGPSTWQLIGQLLAIYEPPTYLQTSFMDSAILNFVNIQYIFFKGIKI